MNRITAATVCLFTGIVPNAATAAFLDGNDLHDWCSNYPPSAATYVMGLIDDKQLYSVGFRLDTGAAVDLEVFVCLPSGVTGEQARDVVCKFLEDNPASRHWSAASLATQGLAAAFPCR